MKYDLEKCFYYWFSIFSDGVIVCTFDVLYCKTSPKFSTIWNFDSFGFVIHDLFFIFILYIYFSILGIKF